jgi:hypothetical protein
MEKKQNIEIACPYKSATINPSLQQLQSLSSLLTPGIVKHGLGGPPIALGA